MSNDQKNDSLIGTVVEGSIINITNFGAFVRLSNGEDGLVHISEMADGYVEDIEKIVKLGDVIKVKVLARNAKGKLDLSIKQADKPASAPTKETPILKKTKHVGFEDKMNDFMKKSEEKQIDVRRNLKHKQGISKKRR